MSDTVDTTDTSTRGNTDKSSRARNWFFTWNGYNQKDIDTLNTWCQKNCEKYTFQEETGESGNKHLQGCLEFKHARHFNALHKLWPGMHLEITKDVEASREYCSKTETRTGKLLTNIRVKNIKDPLNEREPKHWQTNILELIGTEPDDRTINWFWDPVGGVGKTSLAKHLCIKRPNEVLYISGKSSDIKYGITSFLENAKNDLKICIFDFTRSTEAFISYQAIEEVKNGIFYNTKYESKMILFNSPHIIIFANFPPDQEKLSKDRWNIVNIAEQIVEKKYDIIDEDNIE